MKPLIVAYSLTGNTTACAFALAKELDAGVFLLEETKPRHKKGVYVTGGCQAMFGLRSRVKRLPDLSGVDTVLLGMPVWAGTMPPAIRTMLESSFLYGKSVYAFATLAGNGSMDRLESSLKTLVESRGGRFHGLFVQQGTAAKPITVENIADTAREWANEILA